MKGAPEAEELAALGLLRNLVRGVLPWEGKKNVVPRSAAVLLHEQVKLADAAQNLRPGPLRDPIDNAPAN